MNDSGRLLGISFGIGAVGALVLGVALGLAQEESFVRWIAYMFSVAGAITIGLACFSGAPTSSRKHVARRLRTNLREPEAAAVVDSKPLVSRLVVLLAAGVLLIAVGTGIELAT